MRRRQGRHLKVASAARREGLRGIRYRSLAEKRFADVLDLICRADGYDWEYEPCIKLTKLTKWHPDFAVISDGHYILFHEIKAFKAVRGKRGTTYRAVSPQWPTTRRLWQEFGVARLQVWKHLYGDKFRCMETIDPDV